MSVVATSTGPRPTSRSEHELVAGLTTVAAILLAAMPYAALALSTTLLFVLPARTPRHVRIVLGVIAATGLALMAGTRPLDPAASNDIDGYFAVYQDLAAGDLSELTHFGAGFEVALPLLFWVWGLVLPPLTANGLMFCSALTSALLVLVWAERTLLRQQDARPALIGLCIVMLNLYFSTQLIRQYLSLIVLLYAFTSPGRIRPIIWVVVAATFHLTAFVFYGLYVLLRRGWGGWLAVLAIATIVRLYFAQLLVALEILPEAAADKLAYYVDNDEDSTSSDLGSMRMVILLCGMSIVALAAHRFRPAARAWPWLAAPWMTLAIQILLLPVPLASLRTTLMVHSVLPGLFAWKMFPRRAGVLLPVLLVTLLLYKLAGFATVPGSANLRSTLAMLQGFFA